MHEKLQLSGSSQIEEKMPTWIPSIKGNAFGAPEDVLRSRLNGDSFVGAIERQNQKHYYWI